MSGDSIGRPATPPPTTDIAPGETCAIAPVRGDVTTTRAAAAVRARRRDSGRATERVRGRPARETR